MSQLATCRALFLAPHLDDVALSCGGRVAQCAASGERPFIVTLLAGIPPQDTQAGFIVQQAHARWGAPDRDPASVVKLRRAEDAAAARVLDASTLWLEHLDLIYRDLDRRAVRGELTPADAALVTRLSAELVDLWGETPSATVYAPLGVGGAVDHKICHAATTLLREKGAAVLYYEDFPYAIESPDSVANRLSDLSLTCEANVVGIDEYIERRVEAVACYESQNYMLFARFGGFAETIRRYSQSIAVPPARYAERLWKLTEPAR